MQLFEEFAHRGALPRHYREEFVLAAVSSLHKLLKFEESSSPDAVLISSHIVSYSLEFGFQVHVREPQKLQVKQETLCLVTDQPHQPASS